MMSEYLTQSLISFSVGKTWKKVKTRKNYQQWFDDFLRYLLISVLQETVQWFFQNVKHDFS